jgi:hypothetical protein
MPWILHGYVPYAGYHECGDSCCPKATLQVLFRPIDRDEFRGLLIDSSVGLRFVVAARALACGEFSGVL